MSSQPIKKSGPFQKPRSKTVKRRKKPTSAGEIIKKQLERLSKPHPEYGTSKLEKRFEENFLKKLGIDYEKQFYAKDIKRYYDFYIPSCRVLIEIDGDYYHSYGLIYEQMSPMQKRNHRVDEIKNEWAAMHGIPLIRIWEHDINNNPSGVMSMLKEKLGVYTQKMIIDENKKKRH
jgi:very-short-patch-repair endonuclease